MDNNYEFYSSSRIVMCADFEIPPDSFLLAHMLESIKPRLAMAQYLVMGKGFDPNTTPISDEEISDITVLNAVLGLLEEAGTKDIHRIVSLPLFMLRRWHESVEKATKEGWIDNEDDIPSVSELEDMMGL